jgi:hypothetical protein
MFAGWTFHVDEDAEAVTALLEGEGGEVLREGEPPRSFREKCFWLVNQRYLTINREDPFEPRVVPVVLSQWVNMCVCHKRVVDHRPFQLSSKEEEEEEGERKKARKEEPVKKYLPEEDARLWDFYSTHHGDTATQAQLWAKAVRMNILPGRSARSMQNRFPAVKAQHGPFDVTNKHYSSVDDQALMAWAWCWQRYGGKEGAKPWEAAEAKFLLLGRKASQMEARFKKLSAKHGADEVKRMGEENVNTQSWLDYFDIARD